MDRRLLLLAGIGALVLLAACVAAPGADDPAGELGVVDGIAYDDALDIDASDGLDAEERAQVIARAMARVEHLRGLPFERGVDVTVISRDEFDPDRIGRAAIDGADAEWENVVWQALFQVDRETDVRDEFDAIYGGTVLGYYSPADEEIVLIVDDPERAMLDRNTLAHELVHALQDQHFGLDIGDSTLDQGLAGQALIEGDANYIEHAYDERCQRGEWECLERPHRITGAGSIDFGVFVTLFFPYSDGPTFVAELRDQGGWDRVNAAYDRHPNSTAAVIHPERYPDAKESPRLPARETGEWTPYTDLEDRETPATTVGEAALFAMFWANGVIDRGHLYESDDPRSPYNYAHPTTTGWTGDRLVPYRNDAGETGYVFVTAWESEADAREFESAYRTLLETHGGEPAGPDRYDVPEASGFGGTYALDRSDRRVTIAYGPDQRAVDTLHPAVEPAPTAATAGSGFGSASGSGSTGATAQPKPAEAGP